MKRIPIIFDKHITGVYVIKCTITHKIYIGSSVDIRSRWNNHIHELRQGVHANYYLQAEWNTYGEDSFEFSILDTCGDLKKLQSLEQHYLDLFRSYNRNIGYNIAQKAFLPPMTKESRKKQSESLKKNTQFIEKNRKFLKDLHNDPVRHKHLINSVKNSQKVKNNLKKLNESQEHKLQVQELLKMVHNDPQIQDMVKNLAKSNIKRDSWRKSHGVKEVAQLDLDGNLIAVYTSLSAAEKKGFDRSSVTGACRGTRKSNIYKGFKWMYLEDYNKLMGKEVSKCQ